jgi:uncharacterized membrane protein
VSKPKRILAVLAYLLSIMGWLYVFLFQRKEKLAVYHARQSMMLTIVAIGGPVVWAGAAWIVSWIPLVGPLLAAASFSIVILTYVALASSWVVGMIYALQAKMKPIPIVGKWAERIQIGD